MKIITTYETFDGQKFRDLEAAKAHEATNIEGALVGLTLEQVKSAVAREDGALPLADAIEKLGSMIAKARIAGGGTKRKRKVVAQAAAPSPETETQVAA